MQIVLALMALLFSCAVNRQPISAPLSHLEELHRKHPYALLGDDFGLLTSDDLAMNGCIAEPTPISNDSISYPYWQCFSMKNSYFECDSRGWNADEHRVVAILAIGVLKDGKRHEYLSPRGIDMKDCRSHQKDWKRITANQNYVCLMGSLCGLHDDEKSGTAYWVFEAFKTPAGCDSYFKGGCDLNYRLKNHCGSQARK